MVYWRGDIYYHPDRSSEFVVAPKRIQIWRFYFLRDFGARCDNALAAAVFAGFELDEFFKTDEAALAARALVLRWAAICFPLIFWPLPCQVASGFCLCRMNGCDSFIVAHFFGFDNSGSQSRHYCPKCVPNCCIYVP